MSTTTTPASSRWRQHDGRLRVWLRVLIIVVVMFVAVGLTQTTVLWLEPTPALALHAVVVLALAIPLFAWLTRRLDRRNLGSYGMRLDRGWWADMGAGVAAGLLIAPVYLLIDTLGGWAQITDVWAAGRAQPAVGAAVATAVLVNVAVAAWEELVFRGHLMSNASEALARTRPPARAVIGAWIIATVVFAPLHANQLLHPDAAPTMALLWLAMGALFGLAYAYTGRLGLPIGIHLAGNLSFAQLFGLSGDFNGELAAIVRLDVEGPGWLAGPGGLAQLIAVAVAYLAVWGWLRRRHAPVHIHESIARAEGGVHEHAS